MCGQSNVASAADADIEWSVSAPDAEAAPKSFPTVAIRLHNRSGKVAAAAFTIAADQPLQSVSPRETTVELQPAEEKTLLHTLYVPPDAREGSAPLVAVRGPDGAAREARVRIKSAPAFKAKAVDTNTRFVRSGEKATYKIRIDNTGNTPLNFAFAPKTSPEKSHTRSTPETLMLQPGTSGETSIDVQSPADVAAYTAFVTMTEILPAEMPGGLAKECLYFHTEVFPPHTPADRIALYETLKGSVQIGIGDTTGGRGGRSGSSAVFSETLAVEGLVSEETRLQFLQSFTHPSERRGELSSALASLPRSSRRNFFVLGLLNPHWDLELGEISAASGRLLSSRETGDGIRVAVRPLQRPQSVQVEVFTERNTLTLNRKDVFGASVSGSPATGPLEFWRVGSLSKRGDEGPQGRNWDSVGLETAWKLPVQIPLRAEFSVAAGQNDDGRSGSAWLGGLHYNRTIPGEKEASPVKAGFEYAAGGKSFPGTQNGREDRRAYASIRFSESPTYAEAYANYNESIYKVVPKIERTLAEEQDVLPEFLRTSQSRQVNAGMRWRHFGDNSGGWRLPSGSFELQQANYFNRSNFFDRADEKAAALNLSVFERSAASGSGATWDVNLAGRGGVEVHEDDTTAASESRFITAGADVRYSRAAPEFIEKIAGPGTVSFEFSGRYTQNLDGDRRALNRTGLSATANATWQTNDWSATAASALYSYENAGISTRTSASVERRVSSGWWAGMQAALTTRDSTTGRGGSATEGAVMLTFRHDFSIPVPWLPRRGQATGRVFEDVNNNGRFDRGEPPLPGVKVAAGKSQALSDANGNFAFPAMESGKYPLVVTPPPDVHYNESSARKTEQVELARGMVTTLSLALTKPTACEGQVKFARSTNADAELLKAINGETKADLAGYEIIATDAAGRQHRGFTRADGFFALYLEPGTYEVELDATTLRSQQMVTPQRRTLTVEQARIENIEFVVTEQAKKIRRTFTADTQ
jgi:hypothetical protein